MERPWDIIDEIQAQVGHIRNKAGARPGTEGYYGEYYLDANRGAAARLFTRTGTAPDSVVEALRDGGALSKDASVDDLWEALSRANGARKAFNRSDHPERQAERFTRDLTRQERKRCKRPVPSSALTIGDNFEFGGKTFKVQDIDPDSLEVTIVDGKRYGRQQIPDGAVLFADSPCPTRQKPKQSGLVRRRVSKIRPPGRRPKPKKLVAIRRGHSYTVWSVWASKLHRLGRFTRLGLARWARRHNIRIK